MCVVVVGRRSWPSQVFDHKPIVFCQTTNFLAGCLASCGHDDARMGKRRRPSDGEPQEGGSKRPLGRDAKPGKSAMKGGRSRALEAGKLNGKVDGKLEPDGVMGNGKLEPTSTKGKAEPEPKAKEAKGKAKAHDVKRRKTEPVTTAPATTGFTSFKLVFGTYERLLYGLHCTFPSPSSPLLTPLFSFPAHPSSIRTAVASPSGKHLLTSSTASSALTLWSLRSRRELGSLSPPSSSTSSSSDAEVTCVAFEPKGRVVLVGDEHGEIWVYRTKDWVLVSRLKGHKGRVNSVAVQKDGRVGLSVGKDRCLRMWDLGGGQGKGKGKPVASTRLGEEGDVVKWDLEGQKIAVVTGPTLTVYDTVRRFLSAPGLVLTAAHRR